MDKPGRKQVWLAQFRANFLILAVLLVLIGLAFAVKYPLYRAAEGFNLFHAILLIIGVVSAHSSVNLFNEYSDFKTKIDFNTIRNPFSGGSGMLTEGHTQPKNVLFAAILTLVIGLAIGIYFVIVSHWFLLILIGLGAFAVLFYTNFLAKILLGELFAGLTLGTFVVLGTYIAMTATPEAPFNYIIPYEVLLMSIPPGILTALLLFLNEFPDMEADRQGGRYHLVIKLGRKKAAYLYAFGMFLTFGTIIVLPLIGFSSFWAYIALLPLPLALKSSQTALKFSNDIDKIIPALGSNVMVVLGTDLLLAASVFLALI